MVESPRCIQSRANRHRPRQEEQGMPAEIARGLEGVYVAETKLCRIDGQLGELVYAGYDIYDLAEHSTFAEVALLLWNQRLPSAGELDELKAKLRSERHLDDILERLLSELGPVRPP